MRYPIAIEVDDKRHADVLKFAGKVAAIYLPDTKGANPIKDWQD
jgi:hypothetical protein